MIRTVFSPQLREEFDNHQASGKQSLVVSTKTGRVAAETTQNSRISVRNGFAFKIL